MVKKIFVFSYYEENSFNRKPYGECVEKYSNNRRKYFSQFNNPADCEENEGTWTEYYSFLELAPDKKTESQVNISEQNFERFSNIILFLTTQNILWIENF